MLIYKTRVRSKHEPLYGCISKRFDADLVDILAKVHFAQGTAICKGAFLYGDGAVREDNLFDIRLTSEGFLRDLLYAVRD